MNTEAVMDYVNYLGMKLFLAKCSKYGLEAVHKELLGPYSALRCAQNTPITIKNNLYYTVVVLKTDANRHPKNPKPLDGGLRRAVGTDRVFFSEKPGHYNYIYTGNLLYSPFWGDIKKQQRYWIKTTSVVNSK